MPFLVCIKRILTLILTWYFFYFWSRLSISLMRELVFACTCCLYNIQFRHKLKRSKKSVLNNPECVHAWSTFLGEHLDIYSLKIFQCQKVMCLSRKYFYFVSERLEENGAAVSCTCWNSFHNLDNCFKSFFDVFPGYG